MICQAIDIVMGRSSEQGPPIYVQQFDVNSRTFVFRVFDEEGNPFVYAEDAVVGAVYKYRRCKGTEEYEVNLCNGNVLATVVPAEVVQLDGPVEMQIKIHQNGGVLHSPVIAFEVLKSIKKSETETSEPQLILEGLIESTRQLIASIETKLENGEFNGKTPVRGKDYWTPKDKAEVITEAKSAFVDVSEVGM